MLCRINKVFEVHDSILSNSFVSLSLANQINKLFLSLLQS